MLKYIELLFIGTENMTNNNQISITEEKNSILISSMANAFKGTIETKLGDNINKAEYEGLPGEARDVFIRLANSISCESTNDNMVNHQKMGEVLQKAGYKFWDVMLECVVESIQLRLGKDFSPGIDGKREKGL